MSVKHNPKHNNRQMSSSSPILSFNLSDRPNLQ